ncbi:hydroxypyruvate isomerase family protein [Paenibacillus sacheonensis]|uniref:TIM barrel protein n=1 Tax=Paenibacillus sacheonensis TaxID=742054 RepID=A0A7X5C3W1_9BACL|nr:TIM barrel protein [Paenibacillus sacheonensis]MBM7569240.1 hydroxypyruvate isomerase [Paenibacillus sacheonensis]NBC71749.1 TIM barrel protein [Paenibacillus sacheonensis]
MIFSVSLDAVFSKTNLSFEERVERSRELGYTSIEFWGWGDKDLDRLAEVTKRIGLQVGSFCTKYGELVDPAKRGLFLEGLQETIAAAKKVDCASLIVTVGNALEGVSREAQHDSIVEGLRAAVPLLEEAGITLVVEPLNMLVDHAGYYLVRSDEAFEIIDEVGSPYVKVLYDVYHQQISEGNLISTIQANIDRIGYFHIADHPGRHEIGTGEINYRNVLDAIRETGYAGPIGLEYFPLQGVDEGLKAFLKEYA